jgi:hypothetical protein
MALLFLLCIPASLLVAGIACHVFLADRPTPGRCRTCGYAVDPAAGPVCPECGGDPLASPPRPERLSWWVYAPLIVSVLVPTLYCAAIGSSPGIPLASWTLQAAMVFVPVYLLSGAAPRAWALTAAALTQGILLLAAAWCCVEMHSYATGRRRPIEYGVRASIDFSAVLTPVISLNGALWAFCGVALAALLVEGRRR